MLDYAANAVVYWPVEVLRARFEATGDADERLQEVLDPETDADAFWERVGTNLKAGKVRLVFISDEIRQKLRRIVEFLNSQMSPAEVLAVEIKQYLGEGRQTLCRAWSVKRLRRRCAREDPRAAAGTSHLS